MYGGGSRKGLTQNLSSSKEFNDNISNWSHDRKIPFIAKVCDSSSIERGISYPKRKFLISPGWLRGFSSTYMWPLKQYLPETIYSYKNPMVISQVFKTPHNFAGRVSAGEGIDSFCFSSFPDTLKRSLEYPLNQN